MKCIRSSITIGFLLILLILGVEGATYPSEEDREIWDKRYSTEGYLFGKDPIPFLKEHINILPKGKALDLAMGEGKDAVFLAKNGYEVDGCDISEVAIKKAYKLANENNVKINAFVVDLEKYEIPKGKYDLITCFYYLQRDLIPQIKKGLKVGGMAVFETYTIDNLKLGFPYGPKNEEFLLKHNELLDFFHSFDSAQGRDFRVLYYREGVIDNKKALASIITQRVR